MSVKSDLYLRLMKKAEVTGERVRLKEIAELSWEESASLAKLKEKIVFVFPDKKKRYVLSALYLIERIHEDYPGLTVNAIGEADIVVEKKTASKRVGIWPWVKAAFVSLIVFFGAAFAIMSFNNDVSVEKLFAEIFRKLTGQESNGFSVIEISYSVGLTAGILLFYNHIRIGQKSQDPTPVQVEMELYETDINTALTERADRSGIHKKAGNS